MKKNFLTTDEIRSWDLPASSLVALPKTLLRLLYEEGQRNINKTLLNYESLAKVWSNVVKCYSLQKLVLFHDV